MPSIKRRDLTFVKSLRSSERRRLENNLQCVLNFTRATVTRGSIAAGLPEVLLAVAGEVPCRCVRRMPSAGRIGISSHACNCTTRKLEVDLIRAELRFVEQVKELQAELHVDPFANFEVLIR